MFRSRGQRFFSNENLDPLMRAGVVGRWVGGGSGLVFPDRSGYNNHAAFVGTPRWIVGAEHQRYAIQLDGSTDYLDVGSIVSGDKLMLDGGNFTIAAWINPTKTGDDHQRIVDKSNAGSAAGGYGLWLEVGTFYPRFGINGNTAGSADTAPAANTWSRLVVTKTAGNTIPKFYINGVQTGYSTIVPIGNPPNTTANLRIGSWYSGTTRNFNGGLGDVTIVDRVWGDAEIAKDYNASSIINVIPRRAYKVLGGTETASVSPVVIEFAIPAVTATYTQVATASVAPVAIDLSVPTVAATYFEVSTVSVSPAVIELSLPAVTATYSEGGVGVVAPVVIDFVLPAVTATYVQEETASISPVVIDFVLPAVTATYSEGGVGVVAPVVIDFVLPVVTATYIQVEEASVAPVVIDFVIPPVTATNPSANSGQIKYYNGGAWVAKTVKVWNGSVMEPKPMKHWNGVAWVATNY